MLNGLGGEIYRNYYFTSRKRFIFQDWMHNHVFYPNAELALHDKNLWNELESRILNKIGMRIDCDFRGNVDFLTMRRYYSDVRMPDCDGNNHNAHNQLAFYLTPFIEHRIIQEGYEATPYIGSSGKFQAAMLSYLDENVAGMDSHYGFPLSKEPLAHMIYSLIKGYLPSRLWIWRTNLRYRYRGLGLELLQSYLDLHHRSQRLCEIDDVLLTHFPEINWDMMMREYASKPNAIFMGEFLREFQHKITF